MTLPVRALRAVRLRCAGVAVCVAVGAVGCTAPDGGPGSGGETSTAGGETTSTTPGSTAPGGSLSGTWASRQAIFTFSDEGFVVWFECATGGASEAVQVGADGRWRVDGWYLPDTGGPGDASATAQAREPAVYAGSRSDDQLVVTVELDSGVDLGPYRVTQGADLAPERCV